jgi:hypothetical protein
MVMEIEEWWAVMTTTTKIRLKYVLHRPIALVKHRRFDSSCWHDFLKVRQIYLLDNRSMS